jgi:uncharacterized membrane protein
MEGGCFFMDKKTTGIVGYLTWIGFIIAICAGDRKNANFHLNQALLCLLGSTLGSIVMLIPIIGPIIGGLWNILMLVCWILGLVAAINEEEKEIPVLGKLKILNFNSDNTTNTNNTNSDNNSTQN